MAAPYSDDLRQKAVEAVKRGERKKDVSEIFDISRNTLDLWLKRVEEIGNSQPIMCMRSAIDRKLAVYSGVAITINLTEQVLKLLCRYIYRQPFAHRNGVGGSCRSRPGFLASIALCNQPQFLRHQALGWH
jgi:Homeodomain-like domain